MNVEENGKIVVEVSDKAQGGESVGTRGESAPSATRFPVNEPAAQNQKWWPSCFHKRWTKLDKTKFRDRIVWLKECRACGKKKTEVVYRDLNSHQVYTGRDVFAVKYQGGERSTEGE